MSSEERARARVVAILVVWREIGTTLEAIESLHASEVPLQQVICVAQELSSVDLSELAAVLPGGGLIALAENIGFSAAVNLGIHQAIDAGAEFLLLMNNDATVSPSFVTRCLTEFDGNARLAVVGPAIAYASRPDKLWFAGAAMSRSLGVVWHRGHFGRSTTPPPSRDSDYVPSCCALMSARAFQEVGPFREDFFLYYEDVEWGERARSAGWHLRYLGELLGYHVMAGSSDTAGSRLLAENSAYYLARNPLRYARETPGHLRRFTRTFGTGVVWTLYNATRIEPSKWPTVGRALVQGLSDGIAGRMGRRDLARASLEIATGGAIARHPRGR